MAVQSIADGVVPLHVSEEDSLIQDGPTDVEITMDDVSIVALIRSHEAAGRPGQAAWLRSAYRALQATRHASQRIRVAMGGNETGNGNNGKGSNGTAQPK